MRLAVHFIAPLSAPKIIAITDEGPNFMRILSLKRAAWFTVVAVLVVVTVFAGGTLFPELQNVVLSLLIVVVAVSVIALLFIDRKARRDQSFTDLNKVEDAIEAERRSR